MKSGYSRYSWIGGKMDINGAPSWSDGSHPTFDNWQSRETIAPPYCSCVKPNYWFKTKCGELWPFICRLPSIRMNSTTLKLEYKKEQLNFSSFQVWYTYRVAKNDWIIRRGKKISTVTRRAPDNICCKIFQDKDLPKII